MHDVTKIILQSGRDQTPQHRVLCDVQLMERRACDNLPDDGRASGKCPWTLLAQSGRKRIRIDGVNSNKAYNG